MNAADYENLVAEIAQDICQVAPELYGSSITSGRNNRIQGASGFRHQIDVSVTFQNTLYLIECKQWKKRIGAQEVLVLKGRQTDIQANYPHQAVYAVLISVYGASRQAKQLAQYFGIKIETAKSPAAFGLQIGRYIHEKFTSLMGLGDIVVAEIVSAPDLKMSNRCPQAGPRS